MSHRNLEMELKVGSTGIPFEALLETSGVPFDLTGCTVQFRMKPVGGTSFKVDAPAVPDPDQSLAGRRGYFKYFWIPADVNTVGVYDVAPLVTKLGGEEVEFPAEGFGRVIINPGL